MKTKLGFYAVAAISTVLASLQAHASEGCGTYAGKYVEVDAGGSSITRIVYRYIQPDDRFSYIYELDFGGDVAPKRSETEYAVEGILNGHPSHLHGVAFSASAGGGAVNFNCADGNMPAVVASVLTVTPGLFADAASGNHLNAWQGSLQVNDSRIGQVLPSVPFKFEAAELDQLQFDAGR